MGPPASVSRARSFNASGGRLLNAGGRGNSGGIGSGAERPAARFFWMLPPLPPHMGLLLLLQFLLCVTPAQAVVDALAADGLGERECVWGVGDRLRDVLPDQCRSMERLDPASGRSLGPVLLVGLAGAGLAFFANIVIHDVFWNFLYLTVRSRYARLRRLLAAMPSCRAVAKVALLAGVARCVAAMDGDDALSQALPTLGDAAGMASLGLGLGLGLGGVVAAAAGAAQAGGGPAAAAPAEQMSPRSAALLERSGNWPTGDGSHLGGLPSRAALPEELADAADTAGLPRDVAAAFAEICCGLHADEGMPPLDECLACCSEGCTQQCGLRLWLCGCDHDAWEPGRELRGLEQAIKAGRPTDEGIEKRVKPRDGLTRYGSHKSGGGAAAASAAASDGQPAKEEEGGAEPAARTDLLVHRVFAKGDKVWYTGLRERSLSRTNSDSREEEEGAEAEAEEIVVQKVEILAIDLTQDEEEDGVTLFSIKFASGLTRETMQDRLSWHDPTEPQEGEEGEEEEEEQGGRATKGKLKRARTGWKQQKENERTARAEALLLELFDSSMWGGEKRPCIGTLLFLVVRNRSWLYRKRSSDSSARIDRLGLQGGGGSLRQHRESGSRSGLPELDFLRGEGCGCKQHCFSGISDSDLEHFADLHTSAANDHGRFEAIKECILHRPDVCNRAVHQWLGASIRSIRNCRTYNTFDSMRQAHGRLGSVCATRCEEWVIRSVAEFYDTYTWVAPDQGASNRTVARHPTSDTVATYGKMWTKFRTEFPAIFPEDKEPRISYWTFVRYIRHFNDETNTTLLTCANDHNKCNVYVALVMTT
jgi:hypothetical protein